MSLPVVISHLDQNQSTTSLLPAQTAHFMDEWKIMEEFYLLVRWDKCDVLYHSSYPPSWFWQIIKLNNLSCQISIVKTTQTSHTDIPDYILYNSMVWLGQHRTSNKVLSLSTGHFSARESYQKNWRSTIIVWTEQRFLKHQIFDRSVLISRSVDKKQIITL